MSIILEVTLFTMLWNNLCLIHDSVQETREGHRLNGSHCVALFVYYAVARCLSLSVGSVAEETLGCDYSLNEGY